MRLQDWLRARAWTLIQLHLSMNRVGAWCMGFTQVSVAAFTQHGAAQFGN